MEMRMCQLRPRPAHEQTDARALEHWAAYVHEFPEVAQRHIFFVTHKSRYEPGEELTASYGSGYHRAYSAFGFDATSPVPALVDSFTEADLARRSWPLCVPAWWNPDMQPVERPAFRGHAGGGTSAQSVERWMELVADDAPSRPEQLPAESPHESLSPMASPVRPAWTAAHSRQLTTPQATGERKPQGVWWRREAFDDSDVEEVVATWSGFPLQPTDVLLLARAAVDAFGDEHEGLSDGDATLASPILSRTSTASPTKSADDDAGAESDWSVVDAADDETGDEADSSYEVVS